MQEEKQSVVIVSNRQQDIEPLQELLSDFQIMQMPGAIDITNSIQNGNRIAVIVFEIETPLDLMQLEVSSTSNPHIPHLAVMAQTGETDELISTAKRFGAMAICSENKPEVLAKLVESVPFSFRNPETDQNAEFLTTIGNLSREISRLQSEFTEMTFRTLPERFVAADTRDRLQTSLSSLREISIQP